jgi:hypothetical protein
MDDESGVMDRAKTVQATKKAAELPSTWRVYRKEFLLDSRHVTRHEAMERYDAMYRGRVEEWDARFDEDLVRSRPYELWVRKWNLAAEFKHEAAALEHASLVESNARPEPIAVEVVPRNSRREHELKAYGVAKLRV